MLYAYQNINWLFTNKSIKIELKIFKRDQLWFSNNIETLPRVLSNVSVKR